MGWRRWGLCVRGWSGDGRNHPGQRPWGSPCEKEEHKQETNLIIKQKHLPVHETCTVPGPKEASEESFPLQVTCPAGVKQPTNLKPFSAPIFYMTEASPSSKSPPWLIHIHPPRKAMCSRAWCSPNFSRWLLLSQSWSRGSHFPYQCGLGHEHVMWLGDWDMRMSLLRKLVGRLLLISGSRKKWALLPPDTFLLWCLELWQPCCKHEGARLRIGHLCQFNNAPLTYFCLSGDMYIQKKRNFPGGTGAKNSLSQCKRPGSGKWILRPATKSSRTTAKDHACHNKDLAQKK